MRPSSSITPVRRGSAAAATTRLSSAKMRSPATRRARRALGSLARRWRLVLEVELAGEAGTRSVRSGRRAAVVGDHPHAARREVVRAAGRVDGSPPARGRAIALMVRSRCARSSSSDSPQGLMSTCQAWPGPTTRQAPKASESSKRAAPAARAIALAASRPSPSTTTSRSAVARPGSWSRTAPPTIQAGSPASAAP